MFINSTDEIVALPCARNEGVRNCVGSLSSFPIPVYTIGTNAISSMKLTQLGGPTTLTFPGQTIGEANGASFLHIGNFTYGSYSLRVDVTDGAGQLTSKTFSVTFPTYPEVNSSSPMILPTFPYYSEEVNGAKSSESIIASGSYQLFAQILGLASFRDFDWEQTSGPSRVNFITKRLSSDVKHAESIVENITYGTYVFRLNVTDTSGKTISSNIKVTFLKSPNATSPITTSPGSSRFSPKFLTNFGGFTNNFTEIPASSASAIDSGSIYQVSGALFVDGTVRDFKIKQLSGSTPLKIAFKSYEMTTPGVGSLAFGFSNFTYGTYAFLIEVTDDRGNVGTNGFKITFTRSADANMAPAVFIGDNSDIFANWYGSSGLVTDWVSSNQPFVFSAVAYDDSTITSFNWKQISGPTTLAFTSSNAAPGTDRYWTTLRNFTYGTYEILFEVVDDHGSKSSRTFKLTFNR